MAKEQWHNWGRTAVTILTLTFVCGITYKTIGHNREDIDTNIIDLKSTNKKVHKIEINQEREIALKEALLSTMSRIENGQNADRRAQESDRRVQQIMVTDIAVISEKVNNLTREDN